MGLFCLLCIPLLFFIRRANAPDEKNSIWALPLGCIAALIQYFTGPITVSGDFGFFCWLSGFVGIISLPVLIPLIVCLFLVMRRVFPLSTNYEGFMLLWLMPLALARSISEGIAPSLLSLVFIPLLWAAQALGIPFFMGWVKHNPRPRIIFCAVAGSIALPIAATFSWWLFFTQQSFFGLLLLLLSLVPTAITFVQGGVGSRE